MISAYAIFKMSRENILEAKIFNQMIFGWNCRDIGFVAAKTADKLLQMNNNNRVVVHNRFVSMVGLCNRSKNPN